MFAVIDIETTGGNAIRDRITEIAVILHDGERTERTFSTLINPETPIPLYITDITGITDDMVADAPRFYEVAREIVELTEGRIFVAHNVNFDYGFIREEFRRLAYDFQRERLCTVRTSRRLIPGQPTYSLGRLCANIGIPLRDRHRALGDAEATAILLERLVRLDPVLARKLKGDPFAEIPASVPRNILSALPEDPGLYYLHDADGKVLLADKSPNVRKDVLRVLKTKKTSGNALPLSTQVQDITWELTGSELLADLQLLAGQKTDSILSKPTRRSKAGIFAYRDQRDYLRLAVGPLAKGSKCIGEFANEAEARLALEVRVRKHSLCQVLSGLEANGHPQCSQFPGGDCQGACMGQEPPADYNKRVNAALEGLGFPYPRFLLLSDGRNHEEISVICVDRGDCVAYGYLDATMGWDNPQSVADLLNPFPSPAEGGNLIRAYLPKLNQRRILPY